MKQKILLLFSLLIIMSPYSIAANNVQKNNPNRALNAILVKAKNNLATLSKVDPNQSRDVLIKTLSESKLMLTNCPSVANSSPVNPKSTPETTSPKGLPELLALLKALGAVDLLQWLENQNL